MFLPLAALLMIISNIEVVARTTKEFAKEVMEQHSSVQGISQTPELANGPELPDGMTGVALQDKKEIAENKDLLPSKRLKCYCKRFCGI